MKTIFLLLTFITCGLSTTLAQEFPTVKTVNYVKYNQIFLMHNSQKININQITPSSAIKLLGKPLSAKKEITETDGLLLAYRYNGCEIYFDKTDVNSVEITKPDWALYMTPNEKTGHAFRVKESISSLKPFFPKSWKSHKQYDLALMLKNKSGEIDPFTWITFMTDKNQVNSIIYAFNNY